MEKPKCKCGLDMVVNEYKGYYDSFKFWSFDKDCECAVDIKIEDFDTDRTVMGAYA